MTRNRPLNRRAPEELACRMKEPSINTETRFVGLPISAGIALARVCLFNENRHSNSAVYKVRGDGVGLEQSRVRKAIEVTMDQLDRVARDVADRIGPAEAQIFKAQKAILGDVVLVEQIIEDIATLFHNAETAVSRILNDYEFRLLQVGNEHIKERATDIGEIRRRLLDVLGNVNPSLQCQNQEHCQRGRNRIIVAEELTPSLTAELHAKQIMGFLTERGGQNSHAAILARALGIPAVSGIHDVHRLVRSIRCQCVHHKIHWSASAHPFNTPTAIDHAHALKKWKSIRRLV